MATMRTFDADGWTPSELVSPDGRHWTAGSLAEERELLARGYRVVPAEEPADDPARGDEPTSAAAATPAAVPDVATTTPPSAAAPEKPRRRTDTTTKEASE